MDARAKQTFGQLLDRVGDMDQAEMYRWRNYLVNHGMTEEAQLLEHQWNNVQSYNQSQDDRADQEQANDPVRQVAIAGGGAATGAAAVRGGERLADALAGGGSSATTTTGADVAAQDLSYSGGVGHNAVSGNMGTGADAITDAYYGTESGAAAGGSQAGAAGTTGTAGATTTTGSGGFMQTAGEVAPWLAAATQAYLHGREVLNDREEAQYSSGNPIRGASTGADNWWDDVRPDRLENVQNWWQMNPFSPQVRILGGATSALFGSGKDMDQARRDAVRDVMHDRLINDDHEITFSDGSTWDIGKDGGNMLEGGAYGGQRHYYDVDWGDKLAGGDVGALNPLAYLFAGTDSEKLTGDTVGMLYNAVRGDGNRNDVGRIRDVYSQTVGTGRQARDLLYAEIQNMEGLSQAEKDAALAEIDLLYGVDNPNASAEDTARARSNERYGILRDGNTMGRIWESAEEEEEDDLDTTPKWDAHGKLTTFNFSKPQNRMFVKRAK